MPDYELWRTRVNGEPFNAKYPTPQNESVLFASSLTKLEKLRTVNITDNEAAIFNRGRISGQEASEGIVELFFLPEN